MHEELATLIGQIETSAADMRRVFQYDEGAVIGLILPVWALDRWGGHVELQTALDRLNVRLVDVE